ncbi:MAG: B12-binding domain-containing radical SAM protein [Desulfuromonas sp.]|nr:MAG: B12-binding domain-containing radical SAM protein [Desulfuromonas sp.]
MKILLVNPPNSGRSIPEERYGIDSIKQILRGEPLALEVLAGNLGDHEVELVDLKAEPDGFWPAIERQRPDLVAFTAMTCEAQTVARLAQELREAQQTCVVVGGIHASADPEFFNIVGVDHIVIGLGKASFRELVEAITEADPKRQIDGVAHTSPGQPLKYIPRNFDKRDLVLEQPPRYDLVERYRENYFLPKLGVQLGAVVSAYGCPYSCNFCCIEAQCGGGYLSHDADAVVRDIRVLEGVPFVRLVDANTFGDLEHARALARRLKEEQLGRHFLADVRSDTVVRHPELIEEWKSAGLRSVVIGFEEIGDDRLGSLNKHNSAANNREAVKILGELGVTVIGDFIIDPGFDEQQFDDLERYLDENPVDLPMLTVLTPLPGTELYRQMHEQIVQHDLDYYTLSNAVLPTRLDEERFYRRYAELLRAGHATARI